MKFPDLTELAARNLREAILRNSLTTLGIAVGVGLQQLVNRSVARAGLFDTVSVRPRQSNPFRSGGGGQRRATEDVQAPRVLDDAARREISLLPNVIEVDPEIRFTAEAHIEPRSQLTLVAGMPPSSESSGSLEGLT